MTTLAPAASALTMSPLYLMPPSAMIGMPYCAATQAASYTAVICGTPMPATTRVVQMEPGPMPTFTQSAPASISARVPSPVATLPAISCSSGYAFLTLRTASMMPLLWPCAESSTTTSTCASTSAATRSSTSAVAPIAAPQSRRPLASRAEFGYCTAFSMSLIVMRPLR